MGSCADREVDKGTIKDDRGRSKPQSAWLVARGS